MQDAIVPFLRRVWIVHGTKQPAGLHVSAEATAEKPFAPGSQTKHVRQQIPEAIFGVRFAICRHTSNTHHAPKCRRIYSVRWNQDSHVCANPTVKVPRSCKYSSPAVVGRVDSVCPNQAGGSAMAHGNYVAMFYAAGVINAISQISGF